MKAAFGASVTALTGELSRYLVEGSYATGNLAAAVFESKGMGGLGPDSVVA